MTTATAAALPTRTDREWLLAQRIRAEYEEMPGLALTLSQAARLWAEDPRRLEPLLLALVREGFLMRHPRGTYRRTGCPRCS